MAKERIAIIDGIRTPMARSGTDLDAYEADALATIPVKEIMASCGIKPKYIDEVIIGNVAQPAHAANVARVIALKSGIPKTTPAVTVHRNCASGMEAITTGMQRLLLGDAHCILAGGVESMSNIPLLFSKQMSHFLTDLSKQKTGLGRLRQLMRFRPKLIKPIVGLLLGLTDPICNQLMGQTAENLAKEFGISRQAQDDFALQSHQRANAAIEKGRLKDEIVPIPLSPNYKEVLSEDNGPRKNQTIEALQKLRPFFDRRYGTVTVGSSSQLTDGAAAVILMTESKAKSLGITPLGYVHSYAYAGCDPHRMGLGPVFATHKALERSGYSMKDIDLIEMNEAFAAQVLANVKAFESDAFAKDELGTAMALGEIDPQKLNVNGGAIALGHPLGMTGTRLVITLLKEMSRRSVQRGLATLCIGGGQGASLILEKT